MILAEKKLTRLYPWLIFIGGTIIFLLGIPHEYQTVYNARLGLFVKTAWHQGLTFFGVEWGNPYPDYTAATTLVSYFSSLLFGKVSVFAVTLPNVIASALVLVFTYLIGAIHSHKWGLYGVVLVLLTSMFFTSSSSLGPDQYVALITTISFYLVYSAQVYQQKRRLYLIPLMLVLGFGFRGPIGLIIPAGVVWGFYLWGKQYKVLILFSFMAAFLFCVCLLLLAFAAYHEGGMSFVKAVFNIQIAHRLNQHLVTTGRYHTVWRYTKNVLIRYAITSVVAIVAIILLLRSGYFKLTTKPEAKLLKHLIVWMVIVFAGIALVPGRESRYVLAITPAIALLAAALFIIKADNGWIIKIQKAVSGRVLIIVLLSYIVLNLAVVNPLLRKKNVTTPLVNKVVSYHLPIGFYGMSPDQDPVSMVANSKLYFTPEFFRTPQQLLQWSRSKIIIIAANEAFNFVKFPIVLQHRIKIIDTYVIGKAKFTVFILEKGQVR